MNKNNILIIIIIVAIIYILFRVFNFNNERYYSSNTKIILSNSYIASRSFYCVCDHKISKIKSESTEIPTTYPSSDGETIYINTTAIPNFVTNYLPNVKYKFVLVSGDTDASIPDDYNVETRKILKNPLLLKWYAQNSTLVNDKLIQLPIGLDLHTLTTNPLWGSIQSEKDQIKDIEEIKLISIKKENKGYSNFHFSLNSDDRREAIAQISKDLVYYEPNKVTRIVTWKNMIKYKYVISPVGNGLDCHRTWEAIILGCIPIVKRSELSTLYDGLPVLIVDKWSDINQKLLDNFNPDYSKIEKIYMKYWIKLFNQYKTS